MKAACPVASYAVVFNEKALGLIYAELLLGPDYLAVSSQLDSELEPREAASQNLKVNSVATCQL